ncbi:hypothetical protein [Peribacillus muralis]|uniref:hypothetical protein n=1 Tax=Peribacillus muralis TaxID=264697 RepID=UPI003D02B769
MRPPSVNGRRALVEWGWFTVVGANGLWTVELGLELSRRAGLNTCRGNGFDDRFIQGYKERVYTNELKRVLIISMNKGMKDTKK